VDVVATTIVEETGKIILACGLSCCLSSVADAAITESETAVDVAETVVCGLSYCLSSVVDVETTDLDAATDLDVAAKVYSFFHTNFKRCCRN
jgi:hypothetical protein